jgi:cytochrome c5
MRTLSTLWVVVVLAQFSLVLAGCDNRDATVETSRAAQSTLSLEARPGVDVSHDLHRGKAVFTGKCLTCHGQEHSGAPQLGSAADWEPRLQQPLDTLIQHAIYGHGLMPPKGGFSHVSDTDVAAAAAYVVSRSERIVASRNRERQALACQSGPTACSAIQSDEVLALHMLWMLGNPNAR